jgi:ArsR family transcriptional regulator, lead/cadmium/zinc/bismuth-responsive transcriptional repressor
VCTRKINDLQVLNFISIYHLHNCLIDYKMKFVTDASEHSAEQAPACIRDEHDAVTRAPLVDAAALEKASRLFRAIGDSSRLRLLSRLAQGEMCVTELAACERESLPTISQRLRVLRAESLIVRRRRGKHINYALADQHVMDLVFNALAHATERPATIPAQQNDFEKEKTT